MTTFYFYSLHLNTNICTFYSLHSQNWLFTCFNLHGWRHDVKDVTRRGKVNRREKAQSECTVCDTEENTSSDMDEESEPGNNDTTDSDKPDFPHPLPGQRRLAHSAIFWSTAHLSLALVCAVGGAAPDPQRPDVVRAPVVDQGRAAVPVMILPKFG